MKLAAIYNVWDGVELLKGSMQCLKNHVDLFIIVYQCTSNFGEVYDPCPEISDFADDFGAITFRRYEPDLSASGAYNETQKRNLGLQIARDRDCTHFLHIDCDEYYQDFGAIKQAYIESGAKGSVLQLYTYFKRPSWQLYPIEAYFVPFIHELMPETVSGVRKYPYYVDPTRRINCENVVLLPFFMHHFSWVRKDIERKARNSSANINALTSNNLKDYHNLEVENAPEGYFLQDFQREIKVVEDVFGIEALLHPTPHSL